MDKIDLLCCDYDKDRRVLLLASEYIGMPKEFIVESYYTGREVHFVSVGPEDPLWDQDGWDGEQCIYRPTEDIPRVDHLVIYHQY